MLTVPLVEDIYRLLYNCIHQVIRRQTRLHNKNLAHHVHRARLIYHKGVCNGGGALDLAARFGELARLKVPLTVHSRVESLDCVHGSVDR